MIWDPHALLMVDTNLVASETRTSLVREEAFKYAGNPLMRLEDKTLTLGGRTIQVRAKLHSPDCSTTYHDSPRLYAIYTA